MRRKELDNVHEIRKRSGDCRDEDVEDVHGRHKFDHIRSERIRRSMHVKDPVAIKLKNERIAWFRRIDAEDETNVAKQALELDILHMRRRGRPKNS